MKMTFFRWFVLFMTLAVCCQPGIAQQKGANPIAAPNADRAEGSCRAVVIGISDYQNPDIPDLKYADKDALAFAKFLQSPAGGSLDENHLQIILNEQATTASIATSLDWLMEESKDGDQAVIYFSGHGDVETKTMFQLGYLLTWDSPARSYVAGAFPVHYLQAVISTLTIEKNVRLMLVTDACRSGKLAGSEIGGSQLTAANLSKQFSNEIKILSCQPNEYSIEGKQWGGGRGAFSFHLINGLYGLADKNGDLTVNLMEIGRYLEDHVTTEVAPLSQLPMTVGNRTELISKVDGEHLSKLKEDKNNPQDHMGPIASRGLLEEVLEKAGSRVQEQFKDFETAIAEKRFLEPAGYCADDLYKKLSKEPALQPLHGTLTRQLATALQDDAQQTLNAWLNSDIEEVVQSGKRKAEKYQHYPALLKRAAELMGEEHYLYPSLLARKHLFEGYLTFLKNPNNPDRELGVMAMSAYRKSLAIEPSSAHTWLFMSMVYAYNLGQPDSAYACSMKAASNAPSWVLPYTNLAFALSNKYKRFDDAKALLDKAMLIDSQSAIIWNYLGTWHTNKEEFDLAENCYRKAIELNAGLTPAYNNLCHVYVENGRNEEAISTCGQAIRIDSTYALAYNNLGKAYLQTDRIEEAAQMFRRTLQIDPYYTYAHNNLGLTQYLNGEYEAAKKSFEKAIALDTSYALAFSNLGNVYRRKGQLTEAKYNYIKAVQVDPGCSDAYNNLGIVYYLEQHYEASIDAFKKAVALDPGDPVGHYSLACLYSLIKDTDSSLNWMRFALQKGFDDYKSLLQDEDLDFVRESAGFQQLMKQYFPDK